MNLLIFLNSKNSSVSVILGNAYSKYYKIGDLITMSLYTKEVNFTIIGFFSEGATLDCNCIKYNLDYYVIMPSFDVLYDPDDEAERFFQMIFYCSAKNEGIIRIKKTNNEDANLIEQCAKNIEILGKKYELDYTAAVAVRYFAFMQ